MQIFHPAKIRSTQSELLNAILEPNPGKKFSPGELNFSSVLR
jgi:hypothetical protein